jgi:hypothetical protein
LQVLAGQASCAQRDLEQGPYCNESRGGAARFWGRACQRTTTTGCSLDDLCPQLLTPTLNQLFGVRSLAVTTPPMVPHMNSPSAFVRQDEVLLSSSASASAVSWSAIFAGASVAAAASLVLLTLSIGLGMLTVASWPYVSGARVAAEAAIALIVMQWVSAALGGYITGRLRTRWIGLHTHEVFFRDTAHGFIAWSVATLVAALFFASAAGGSMRSDDTETLNLTPQRHNEAAGERARLRDRHELVKIVSDSTGETTAVAAGHRDLALQRDPSTEGMPEVDPRSAAKGSIWVALSMLIGAFIASASAALGGRLRDQHP